MTVFRNKHTKHYTQIHNDAIRDKNLSLKARGLHHFMLSFPVDWEFNLDHLIRESGEGRTAIASAIQELADHRYLKKERVKNQDGQFTGWIYDIYELPQCVNDEGYEPTYGKPESRKTRKSENPKVGKPVCHTNNINSTKNVLDENGKDESLPKPLSTEPEDESERVAVVEVEFVEPEDEPAKDSLTTDKDKPEIQTEKPIQTQNQVPRRSTNVALTLTGQPTKLSRQKAMALAESIADSPFASIEEQDDFYQQVYGYVKASNPKLNPGQIEAITSARVRRCTQGVPEPQDRMLLRMWSGGQLRQFDGLQYDPTFVQKENMKRTLELARNVDLKEYYSAK